MSTAPRSELTGSRTAAYVVAGLLATVPAWFFLLGSLGPAGATGGVITLWSIGVVWLVKRRREDPAWDRRPPTGRATNAERRPGSRTENRGGVADGGGGGI